MWYLTQQLTWTFARDQLVKEKSAFYDLSLAYKFLEIFF